MTKDTEALREAANILDTSYRQASKGPPGFRTRILADANRDALAIITAALATPASDVAPVDVMIGNFIAQYDEGAAGCLLDVDDAQALAREFKRMQGLIFCPGVLRCAKCDFRLIKTTLTPAGAFANEEPDSCPNCNVPMWRVTWQDEAHDAYKTAESQMDRALEAEKKLAHPPLAQSVDRVAGGEALRDALVSAACDGIADDYMTSEKHHPGYVLIPSAKFEAILAALKGPAA